MNSYIMAKMKIWTQGEKLWTRTIGSTIFGQGVDSLLFYPIAFLGVWDNATIMAVMITNWALKVGWEIVLTPLTYIVINKLKAFEGKDVFDTETSFNPFSH